MKNIFILFFVLILSACRQGIPNTLSPVDVASCSIGDIENSSLSIWLQVRDCLCNLPQKQQYWGTKSLQSANAQDQVLIALMASCPTSTASLQIQASRQSIHLDPRWNAEKRAFLSLIYEQLKRVVKLREENNYLQIKLKNTIEGIHEIESDMNSMDPPPEIKK